VLDEPTSSLDLDTEARVRNKMKDYLSSRSALIISHRSSLLEDVERLYLLQEGKLEEV